MLLLVLFFCFCADNCWQRGSNPVKIVMQFIVVVFGALTSNIVRRRSQYFTHCLPHHDDDDDVYDDEGYSDDDDDDRNNGVVDDEGWKEIDVPSKNINVLLDDIDGQLMMKLIDDIEILEDKIEEGRKKCQEQDKRRMTPIVEIANLFVGTSFWSHLIELLNTIHADDAQRTTILW